MIHGLAETLSSTISNAQDGATHFNSALMSGTVGIGGGLNLGQKNQTATLPVSDVSDRSDAPASGPGSGQWQRTCERILWVSKFGDLIRQEI